MSEPPVNYKISTPSITSGVVELPDVKNINIHHDSATEPPQILTEHPIKVIAATESETPELVEHEVKVITTVPKSDSSRRRRIKTEEKIKNILGIDVDVEMFKKNKDVLRKKLLKV